jgi:iron(III) transport system ATP-binding protein
MAVSVRFEHLSKAFGETTAVDDVSLTIEPGELFFLLGPSGCGKTTLLRCVAGFCEPDQGSIRIGERDISRLPPHERDTGMVFQSYALWPHMTVAENIGFGLEMRRVPRAEIRQRAAEVLELVRMTDRAQHKPNQLSGGQQQRVALARALVVRPQCLLLDEPLSNLDARLRLDMRSEIRRICKGAGLTAIYVTHDQKEALSVADRLAVFDKGRIQQIGRPQEVYLAPCSTFVANFIGETNLLSGRVVGAEGAAVRVQTPAGTLVSTRPPAGGARAGAAVTVSIRPEVIRLNSPPAGAPNLFSGLVHGTVYQGEVAQHQVSLPAEEPGAAVTLKASELHPKIVARDGTERAQVWIAPEDVVLLAE